MGMKKSLMAMMPLMAMAMMGDMTADNPYNEPLTKEDRDKARARRLNRLEHAAEQRKLKQGQKKFFYGENFVWARDQKNADRKAAKKNWT